MFANYLRKTLTDIFSFLFLFTAVITIYLFELLIVLQKILPSGWLMCFHAVAGTFLFVNIIGNLFKLMFTDSTTRGVILPSLLKPFWQFCSLCEANAPPRAFHCHKCRSCVVKRDHHCVFACCCIGLKNFRYYIVFLFYLALGALYATLLNMFFIWDVLGGFSLFSVIAHFVPFLFWFIGYLDGGSAVYSLLSMLSLSGFLFVINLFILHARQMLRNQTSFEHVHGNHGYDLGWQQNLIEALGERWHLVWLFPTISSKLPGDGLTYAMKEEYREHLLKTK